MRKSRIIAPLFLVLVLVLSACGPRSAAAPTPSSPAPAPQTSTAPAPQASGWDKVLADARKEGTVTIYGTWGSEVWAAMKAAMSQYGVKVESLTGSQSDLQQRILSEQRAKAYVADLYTGGFSQQIALVKDGYGQPIAVPLPSLAEKDVWKIDPSGYEPTKSVFVFGTSPVPSVIINTEQVRQSEIATWQDLLDPKWKNKMVMTDPRTGSGAGAATIWVWSKLGDDFWKKMAAQNIALQVSSILPVQQVSLGDKPVAIFPAYSQLVPAVKAGAPVQIINLKEGTVYYMNGISNLKNAPHPNAALVLLNWVFTKEGQMATGKAAGNYTVRKDVTENWLGLPELNPKNFTFLEPANNADPDASSKGADFAKKIFGTK